MTIDFVGLLAAPQGPAAGNKLMLLKILIFVGVTVLLSILRKVAESREKTTTRPNTVGKTPLPSPPPKKDNPFRNEIEAFLEEVGKRRAGERPVARTTGDRVASETVLAKTLAAPKIEPPRKPVALRPVSATERTRPEPVKTVVLAPAFPPRPGDEMAARKAPGSENLGKQIRSHLEQYLDASRMTNQTQSDLGNAVERTVREHLGQTITMGVAEKEQALPPSEGSLVVAMLRNPSNVRTAIVINEILGPPKGLRRR